MATARRFTDVSVVLGLNPAERELAVRAGREVTYPAGVRLVEEGALADGCWLIRRGRVAVDVAVPGRGHIVVQTLGRGDILGWSWLVPPYRWQFGAQVVETTTAIALDTGQLRVFADQDPSFGYALALWLSRALLSRLQATQARLLGRSRPLEDHRG